MHVVYKRGEAIPWPMMYDVRAEKGGFFGEVESGEKLRSPPQPHGQRQAATLESSMREESLAEPDGCCCCLTGLGGLGAWGLGRRPWFTWDGKRTQFRLLACRRCIETSPRAQAAKPFRATCTGRSFATSSLPSRVRDEATFNSSLHPAKHSSIKAPHFI